MSQEFFQDLPHLKNQFSSDALLVRYLQNKLSAEVFQSAEPELMQLGHLAGTQLNELAQAAEAEEPSLINFDPSGRRIDQLKISSAWYKIEEIAAQFGIVASAYERRYGEYSRVLQMAKLYLFHPSSAFVSCPLAMTDGAARVIELFGDQELKQSSFVNLTSRDAAKFWTSGQWMTERAGGSDVGQTGTTATLKEGRYSLSGTKWFTSATSSQMAMTLARIEGAPSGSKGLSLFYLETRTKNGELNNLEILRLKDKLGTRAMPTAEIRLCGTPAKLIGEPGQGVKLISSMLNITRIYNSICAVGQMHRALALANDYAEIRWAFGKKLSEHPLHQKVLAGLGSDFAGCFLWMMEASLLLGKEETQVGSSHEKSLLRLVTPLLKLFSAKKAIEISSECLESFGGAGYIEDTHLPKLLRDSQVLAIWEGTTNVLSLDFLRALEKEKGLEILEAEIFQKLSFGSQSEDHQLILSQFKKWKQKVQGLLANRADLEAEARNLSFEISQIYTGMLLYLWSVQTSHKDDELNWKIWHKRYFA